MVMTLSLALGKERVLKKLFYTGLIVFAIGDLVLCFNLSIQEWLSDSIFKYNLITFYNQVIISLIFIILIIKLSSLLISVKNGGRISSNFSENAGELARMLELLFLKI